MQSPPAGATNRAARDGAALGARVRRAVIAQAVAVPVGAGIGMALGGGGIALSAAAGALLMVAVNLPLARRVARQAWPRRRRAAVLLAAGRFLTVLLLLGAAHAAGLWLPAVSGGMLLAQAALYAAGFRMLAAEAAASTRRGRTNG